MIFALNPCQREPINIISTEYFQHDRAMIRLICNIRPDDVAIVRLRATCEA